MCRRALVLVAVFAVIQSDAAAAKVIPTKWVETQKFASDRGVVRLYVRKLEFTGRTWKAYVGLANASARRFDVDRTMRIFQDSGRPAVGAGAVMPASYLAAPGIWWETFEAGSTLTHVARVTLIRPAYPTSLAPGKSWFGVFSGRTDRLPKDRLLRIGFGVACFCPEEINHVGVLSTTHRFRLPRG